jgi:hypothetical protein
MSARRMTFVLGTAAGAFLAAGLIPLITAASAHADGEDLSPALDPGFISATDPLLAMLGVTDIGAADPGENFEAMILEIPKLGITDVLTSGTETTNDLAQFGVPGDIGLGMAGVSVNTLTDTMDPALDSSFTIPFTDPLSGLWDVLVMNDFFGL